MTPEWHYTVKARTLKYRPGFSFMLFMQNDLFYTVYSQLFFKTIAVLYRLF